MTSALAALRRLEVPADALSAFNESMRTGHTQATSVLMTCAMDADSMDRVQAGGKPATDNERADLARSIGALLNMHYDHLVQAEQLADSTAALIAKRLNGGQQ
jgi:hypothetical protein